MKKFLQLLLLALFLFLFICPDLFSQGTVETRSFFSSSLGIDKNYYVYLPANYYQSTENYPVVYFFRNREHEWFNTSWRSNGRALKEVADDLIAAGLIGPMILVGPNSGSNRGASQYYGCINMLRPDLSPVAGIGTGMFEDYIIDDLITHIDSTFRTVPDKGHRGIDGFSMGGYISTTIGLRNPTLFSSIGSYDGTLMYYNLDDPSTPDSIADDYLWMYESIIDPIFDMPRNIPYMLEHSATNILEDADSTQLNQIRSNRFHISHSYKDGTGNYLRNKQLVDKLYEKGIRNSWGNPILHYDAIHNYDFADVHATASLMKHWQTFNETKISTPSLIDFGITENSGRNHKVVVFNFGQGDVTVNDIQTNSAEFDIVNLPSLPITLQPDIDTLVFSFTFSPSSNQSFTDTAYIMSDDPATPIAKIILRGQGGSFNSEAGTIYASSNSNLYEINPTSVVTNLIGSYGMGITSIRELSVNNETNVLYGLISYGDDYHDIVKLNTLGGEAIYFNYIYHPSDISGAAFNNDSLLYMGSYFSGNIYTINIYYPYWYPPVNLIASTGLPITGLAFNHLTGELWAAVGSTGNLDKVYKINVSTGDTTYIGKTGLNKSTQDIVFDSHGVLYGLIGGGTDTLITIDTLTGTATKLGSLNTSGLFAIAISPEEPNNVIESPRNIIPIEFNLAQNYPNPFNPSTTIEYAITERTAVKLVLYDILGREVKVLVNEEKNTGYYKLEFNASGLSSGIYSYRLQAGSFVVTKKMVLMK